MTLRTRTIAILTAIAVVLTGVTIVRPAEPAAAAVTGAGYSNITPYGGYLGNYIAPDGTRVYCMDSGRDWPSGGTSGQQVVSSLTTEQGAALSATIIRKLNFALLTWGQTADPTNAAAVSAYIYAYTSNYAARNGQGYAAGAHYIDGNAAVLAAYNVVWNGSETRFAGQTDASATVSVEMANALDGSVTVHTNPSTAKGTLTLEGAVVAGSGASSISVSNGTVVPIRGNPAAGAASYSVSASATFTIASGAQQNLALYTTGSQQRTIRGGFTGSLSFSAADHTDAIPLVFRPVIATRVAAQFVSGGSPFVDGITAGTAAESTAWPRDGSGSYVPVTAIGTLYGPFAEQPDVAATPPVAAPEVGRETITLTGPGDYTSPGTLTAPGPGFYTWVWTIDRDGYHFADQFGLPAESHVVPMALTVASQVTTPEVPLGGQAGDELSVSLSAGEWLTQDGAMLEAHFIGTAYFVPGDVPPPASAVAPVDARVLGTATVTASGPGIYPASSTITAPAATPGYITWVWSLDPASEFAQYFEPWSDGFGLPAETSRVAPPTVATQAVAGVAIGDDVHDTAMVGGVLPATPGSLVFRAYLQAGDEPVCDATTLAFDSSDTPVTVTAVGSYDSPVTQFTEYGTYFWVESFYASSGELIHEGQCGLPEESTLVAPGELTTHALRDVDPGDSAHDTALLSGPVPSGATLSFEAFAQHGVLDGPLCDDSTRIFDSRDIPVDGPGEYESPGTTLVQPGTYYWVETLSDRNGDPLHVGECGLAVESTTVASFVLASTGVPVVRTVLIALELLLIGVTAIGVGMLRRRREYR